MKIICTEDPTFSPGENIFLLLISFMAPHIRRYSSNTHGRHPTKDGNVSQLLKQSLLVTENQTEVVREEDAEAPTGIEETILLIAVVFFVVFALLGLGWVMLTCVSSFS